MRQSTQAILAFFTIPILLVVVMQVFGPNQADPTGQSFMGDSLLFWLIAISVIIGFLYWVYRINSARY